MDLSKAFLPVILSSVITIGILYFLYRKFFMKYMNFKGDGKDKLIYFSFLIGLIAFGNGILSILNELFFIQLNDSLIQFKNIEKGIFILLFYPLVFWTLGFVLHKVYRKNKIENKQSGESFVYKMISYYNSFNSTGQILIILIITIIIAGISSYF